MIGVPAVIVNVTGTLTGEFCASAEATVMVPVYVPAASPAVLYVTVIASPLAPEPGETENHVPPIGDVIVLVAVNANELNPLLKMASPDDGGFGPPTAPVAAMVVGVVTIVGGSTMRLMP